MYGNFTIIVEINFFDNIKQLQMSRRPVGSCKYVMEDCRAFTDYNPNCALNEYLKSTHNIVNSTEYRLFLQRNACQIMGELKSQSDFVNPSGCQCNYNHPPHNYEWDRLFSRQVTPAELYEKNKDLNRPLCAKGKPNAGWTNYC